jgi:hypothetical protein
MDGALWIGFNEAAAVWILRCARWKCCGALVLGRS